MITSVLYSATPTPQVSSQRYDRRLCPLDPSPVGHEQTVGLVILGKVSAAQMRDPDLIKKAQPMSAQTAARLIDGRKQGIAREIGWLYLDERGGRYVALKRTTDDDAYTAFHEQRNPNPNFDGDPEPVPDAPWPGFVRVASCTQTD